MTSPAPDILGRGRIVSTKPQDMPDQRDKLSARGPKKIVREPPTIVATEAEKIAIEFTSRAGCRSAEGFAQLGEDAPPGWRRSWP